MHAEEPIIKERGAQAIDKESLSAPSAAWHGQDQGNRGSKARASVREIGSWKQGNPSRCVKEGQISMRAGQNICRLVKGNLGKRLQFVRQVHSLLCSS